jgi:hypothetical protein
MAIKTTTVITCDDCEKSIVATTETKTGYLTVENACPQNENGEWATDLPPALPSSLTFCDVACLTAYVNKQ